MISVVLFEPEIPQNTGNIARLCACTGCRLYLVGKLGFVLSDKHLKRAGLDYWDKLDIVKTDSLEELIQQNPNSNFFYFTTKTKNKYTKANYSKDDFLVFGPETRGLDEKLLQENAKFCVTIPMKKETRSLNLSNSVAIALYEAIRQLDIEL